MLVPICGDLSFEKATGQHHLDVLLAQEATVASDCWALVMASAALPEPSMSERLVWSSPTNTPSVRTASSSSSSLQPRSSTSAANSTSASSAVSDGAGVTRALTWRLLPLTRCSRSSVAHPGRTAVARRLPARVQYRHAVLGGSDEVIGWRSGASFWALRSVCTTSAG